MAKANKEAVAVAPVDTGSEPPKILSIKGMDHDMKCRGFQFEVGKTYSVDGPVRACKSGFHACPIDQHPLSVFEFYPPGMSRFFEVEQFGDYSKDDTKLASASITINAEISLSDLAARAVKWVFDRAVWSGAATASGTQGAATASGYQGAATASGTRGAATASGDQGAATASGYQGAATASGTRGAATASGDQGAATASGENSHATSTGFDGRVMASGDGMSLCARDISETGELLSIACGISGRDGIKAGVWYYCKAGRLVEVNQ